MEESTSKRIALLEMHPQRGRKWRLSGGAVVGRAANCDVRLMDPLVSRRHARFLTSELGAGIEDLDSANGVYVNGLRGRGITPLHPGDVVQIGTAVLLLLPPDGQPLGTSELKPTA